MMEWEKQGHPHPHHHHHHQHQQHQQHQQQQQEREEHQNGNVGNNIEVNGNGNGGMLYVKVMTDEQLETLRKQIALYASICEQLVEMHKNLTAQQDLAGLSLSLSLSSFTSVMFALRCFILVPKIWGRLWIFNMVVTCILFGHSIFYFLINF